MDVNHSVQGRCPRFVQLQGGLVIRRRDRQVAQRAVLIPAPGQKLRRAITVGDPIGERLNGLGGAVMGEAAGSRGAEERRRAKQPE